VDVNESIILKLILEQLGRELLDWIQAVGSKCQMTDFVVMTINLWVKKKREIS
jgi:hypothetical protein